MFAINLERAMEIHPIVGEIFQSGPVMVDLEPCLYSVAKKNISNNSKAV